MCANFLAKQTILTFSKFAKNGFWGRNFQNLSLDPESPPPNYLTCQFSVKTDNFEFFLPKFGEIALLHAIFLVLIMFRVLQRASWRLK